MLKKFKAVLSLFLVLIIIMGAAGCNREVDAENTIAKNDNILVGFSMGTLKEDRWLRDREIFNAKAKQEGIDTIVSNANNSSRLQLEQVNAMLEKDIDVLVIIPNNCETESACVKAAKAKNVPVISYDRLIQNADVDLYICFDSVKVGELEAKALYEKVPKGNYVIINGSPDDSNSGKYNEGYMNILKDSIDNGNINIVGETWIENWTREEAYEYVDDLIRNKNEKIDCIVAANDSLAAGVIDALSENRIADEVYVSGHDADLTACQRIVDGTQLMTVYKPISLMVDETIKACRILVNKEQPEVTAYVDNNSKNIPSIMIDVVMVNAANMKEAIVNEGFHLEKDIYN